MVFSSIPFLYFFLPAVFLCYLIAPKRFKNSVLLAFSLLFYFWGEPKYVLLMLASITFAWLLGMFIDRNRGRPRGRFYFVLSVAISLAGLLFFKYTDFFISNFNAVFGTDIGLLKLALPIGISFYTFQILSYTIDVYRGNVGVQRSWVKLAAYVTLFPQLIAGPIVRYADVEHELSHRTHSMEKISEGAFRFVIGLAKKILIANVLGELCDIFRESGEKSVLFFWVYAVAYCLHVYFDFSGYSDMAIGLGKIFGFKFPENFNYPYISKSITEFWRRWHMTLGSWFRDYIYIPMGGNRVGPLRWAFNIFVVWFLTGFWHGAGWTFIMWGLYFAVLLAFEKIFLGKRLSRLPAAVQHVYVLFLVIISFVIFNAGDVSTALSDIKGLFYGKELWNTETLYYLRSYGIVLAAAVVGATPLPKKLARRIGENARAAAVLQPVVLAVLLLICTAYLVDGSFNPFLYFRF